MLIKFVEVFAHVMGYFILVIIFLELISLVVIKKLRFKAIFTKELRGTALMNPFFHNSDSYGVHDSWRQQYHTEIGEIFSCSNQALNKWQPLGLWGAPRYHGKYVNIDKYNLRRTTTRDKHNLRQEEDKKIRICFFGGSLVWGWQVRDESTIPSNLLALRSDAVVENHGQLGYVSSQSVIAFMQRMKYEPRPDVVIFIDGFNDIYSAYQSDFAGIEQNAISRKQRAEMKQPESLNKFYRRNSNFSNLMNSILQNKKINNNNRLKNDGILAHDIVNAYSHNIFFVNSISSAYNIKVFFIWHPSIFDKPNLTEYERKVFDMITFCEPIYLSVKKIIETNNILLPQFINLSNIFHENREPMYVDPWHFNERANNLIAAKINELIH